MTAALARLLAGGATSPSHKTSPAPAVSSRTTSLQTPGDSSLSFTSQSSRRSGSIGKARILPAGGLKSRARAPNYRAIKLEG